MKYNIFDRRRRSVYSTKNSTLPLMIQLQSKPRSRIKLLKIVNPTFSVYIIVWCQENSSNDTVTDLNWNPSTDKIDTGKVSGFWMSFVPGTHFYRQKTKYTKPAAKPVPITKEWAHLGPESTVPMHLQLRLFTLQLFLDFCAIFPPEWPLIFLVITINQVIWPSPDPCLGLGLICS